MHFYFEAILILSIGLHRSVLEQSGIMGNNIKYTGCGWMVFKDYTI